MMNSDHELSRPDGVTRVVARAVAVALLVAAVLGLGSGRLAAATVTLTPTKDNTIYGNGADNLSNGAGPSLFAGRNGASAGGRVLRSLLAFNIADSIPAGATINSATLTLQITTPLNNSGTIEARRLLANWGEGTSVAPSGGGGGAPAASGDATWNTRFFNTTPWTTPGGDFSTTNSATQFASGTSGTVVFASAGMAADVQAWLDNPAANFGWLLKAQNETSLAVRFSSRQGTSAPSLLVNYTPPPFHTADTDRDNRLSLLELTRVIELYNTRNGTVRTGCYKVQAGTEDNFAPEPTRADTATVTLAAYHAADANRDGKLTLLELVRVIELYNYRAGSTRTGQYRIQVNTVDGFAPGP
jgi:hypothetical protein